MGTVLWSTVCKKCGCSSISRNRVAIRAMSTSAAKSTSDMRAQAVRRRAAMLASLPILVDLLRRRSAPGHGRSLTKLDARSLFAPTRSGEANRRVVF